MHSSIFYKAPTLHVFLGIRSVSVIPLLNGCNHLWPKFCRWRFLKLGDILIKSHLCLDRIQKKYSGKQQETMWRNLKILSNYISYHSPYKANFPSSTIRITHHIHDITANIPCVNGMGTQWLGKCRPHAVQGLSFWSNSPQVRGCHILKERRNST